MSLIKRIIKVMIVVLIVWFVVLISRCSFINEYFNSENIIKSNELTAIDIAPEYEIESETLTTYEYRKHQDVSYVSISEFISFMEGGIVPLEIEQDDDTMIISYTYEVPSEYQEFYDESTYRYEMTLDAHQDTIHYNDFDMVSSLSGPMITEYETELTLSNIEVSNHDPSVKINLSDYDLDIVRDGDNYYIPLYLANLFFTGSNINVYEMNDSIYIIDGFSEFNELFSNFRKDTHFQAHEIRLHTKRYLNLYFDYFYGLKKEKGIESYKSQLDILDFEQAESFDAILERIDYFISQQDDLHTSFVSLGYMRHHFIPKDYLEDDSSKYDNAKTNYRCDERDAEVDAKYYEDLYVIEVNQFSLETKTLLKPFIDQINTYGIKNVVIDVSCNGGGNIVGVIELLSYMTDEEIEISYMNPVTDAKITEYYESTVPALTDKHFYVYTSAATFSAANLFASIVNDQELGMLIGEQSSGGAAAITYTVLPDGAIIVNSSNLLFTNKKGEAIEDGIPVDVTYTEPIHWEEWRALNIGD
ncbi:S41 family peptidase [Haloplasma contractile]|uniref:Peptidase S41 family protein n=1 Tax=Haloplasma contractile SSD-17B TaxID=1033810 RepID=F7PWA4_9MOLU|nr:S41 family peptidase [Haloplasma contractile]ERJ11238.1 peptidase S41 family protein [Haloplasma contractile SSD-17B]